MDGFTLLLGHLVGDYIVQNDWMAQNKTNPHPGIMPPLGSYNQEVSWIKGLVDWKTGNIACLVHCFFYTIAVICFNPHWITLAGALICGVIHYPVDRFRLAAWWMKNVSWQTQFATGPLAPWSVILVDNIFHLITLYGIWSLTMKGWL